MQRACEFDRFDAAFAKLPKHEGPVMRGTTSVYVAVMGIALGLSLSPAFGTPIPVYSTGNGSTVDGTVDPHWTFTNSKKVTANAFVANNPGVDFDNVERFPNAWLPDTSAGSWIVDNTANRHSGGGPLSFQTAFSLSGLDPQTATLSIIWSVDNAGKLFLNGNLVQDLSFKTHFNWSSHHSVTVPVGSSDFLSGINTLQVILTTADNVFDGVNVHVSGTANSLTAIAQSGDPVAAPEPASLALLGFGLTALGLVRRRTR